MQAILKQIAGKNHVTVEEVRREMQAAIRAGMASTDPQVRQQWKKLVGHRTDPTPEEVIDGLAALVLQEWMALSAPIPPEEAYYWMA